MPGKYDDIINCPHHVSEKRAPMPIANRAAQFSPFAALTGYDAAIEETGRLTEGWIDLDESSVEALNEKLLRIRQAMDAGPEVTVVYFRPDERKSGGAYISVTGVVKKLDSVDQSLLLEDGTLIFFENIYALTGELFRNME